MMKRKLLWAGIAVCCIALFPAGKALLTAYPDLLRFRTMDGFASHAGHVLGTAPPQTDSSLSDLKQRLGKPDAEDPNFDGNHVLEYQCINGFVLIIVVDPSQPDESLMYEVKGGIIRHGVPIGVLVVNRARVAWESAIAAVLLLLGSGMIYMAAFRRKRENKAPEEGAA